MADDDVIIDDPFSRAYDHLWLTLETHADFSNLVKLGNELKYVTKLSPKQKESLQKSDTPQVGLLDGGFTTNIPHTNKVGQVIRGYVLAAISGDERLQRGLFPLEWAVIRAVTRAGTRLMELEFVRNVSITDGTGVLADFEQTKGIQGWFGLMTISVEMYFTLEELIA